MGMCFTCHKMRLSVLEKHLFIHQVDLLDRGVATGPGILADHFNAMVNNNQTPMAEGEFSDLISVKAAELGAGTERSRRCQVKNVVAQRNGLVRKMLDKCARGTSKCQSCKMPSRKIRTHQQNKVFFASGLKRAVAQQSLELRKQQKEAAKMCALHISLCFINE